MPTRIWRCIAETIADIEQTGLTAPIFGHVGRQFPLHDSAIRTMGTCSAGTEPSDSAARLKFGTCTGDMSRLARSILVESMAEALCNASHQEGSTRRTS